MVQDMTTWNRNPLELMSAFFANSMGDHDLFRSLKRFVYDQGFMSLTYRESHNEIQN